jgi:alpha-ketoglutarate-dependent taurine dioxygenase
LISRVRDTFKVDIPLRSLFEAPTLCDLAEKVEAMATRGSKIEETTIMRASRNQNLPLSYAQQRLWFIDQLDPGNPSYNISKAVELDGPLNAAAFEQGLGEIVRRHEILRTTFPIAGRLPVQSISGPRPADVALVDISGLSSDIREETAAGLTAREARRAFDLAEGPLVRFTLTRRHERRHTALATMHHIASDAWSTGIFVEELASLYGSYSGGQPSPLPELVIQYADFACWQRDASRAGDHDRQLDYWKRRLEGAPQITTLAPDYPRPPVQSFRGASERVTLNKALFDSIAKISRQQGATPFMALLAGFEALLWFHTGQQDIVLGIDVANRNRGETERLIGYFANQLVLRTSLSGDQTFKELLAQVREAALGAYANQDVSFDRLVEAMNPERNLRYSPLFQVKFVYQNVPLPDVELEGLVLRPLELQSDLTKFDLTIFLHPSEQGVRGWLEYSIDLYKPETVRRFIGRFERLIERVVEDPAVLLSALKAEIEEEERKRQEMDRKQREEQNFNRFKQVKPRSFSIREPELVRSRRMIEGEPLPLVVEPAISELDPIDWAKGNRAQIEADLLRHGAILFRGFNLASVADFEAFAKTICPTLYAENGELPRSSLGGMIYTPVEYPPDRPILWHNENTFHPRWPGKIMFFCIKPADSGGETPVADSRKVYRMIDEQVREEFARKKIMYLRNYGDGLGLTWQTVFQTTSRAEVEEYCRKQSIEFEWKSGELLRTRAIRPAVARHPRTSEMVWFNQATHWHISCLGQEVKRWLEKLYSEDDLPRHCYYGDGAPIDDSVMEHICDVFKKVEVSFPWMKGDVMVVDNMLAAHARNPYVGSRQVAVAMGDMITDEDLKESETER